MRAGELVLILSLLGGCATGSRPRELVASLQSDKSPDVSARVVFRPTRQGMRVIAEARGLKPHSAHGFHVHEHGKCEGPGYESASGHYNPGGHAHGRPHAERSHLGDLGNLVADAAGEARFELVLEKDEAAQWQRLEGRAVILHEDADDLASQPGGQAGGRLACGIIRRP